MNIKELINISDGASTIITRLKNKSVDIPSWSVLIRDYEPRFHSVMTDKVRLKDKKGGTEPSARISIGLERILCQRMNEFTFAIAPKRIYSNIDSDVKKEIQKAIEAVYKNAHIDSINFKRGLPYYAACEVCTLWYTVKRKNRLYGFDSDYKLKCKVYSPMDGSRLYPIFDEMGDMIAMSFEYEQNVENKTVTFFETYTSERHYIWKSGIDDASWEEVTAEETEEGKIVSGIELVIGKIPCIYTQRNRPVYDGLTSLRDDIEYTISRNSNTIAYNATPIIKLVGAVEGSEQKGEGQRYIRVEKGGDVSYVTWSQASEAVRYQVDTSLKLFWLQAQIPDISFENMRSLGNIGYDARMTLLTDAHLKIKEEEGTLKEMLEREFNLIKAFLKVMNPKWSKEIDEVTADHIITPFIQNDENVEIEKRMKANGGKPLESQLESIRRFGKTDNPEGMMEEIKEERDEENQAKGISFALQNQE